MWHLRRTTISWRRMYSFAPSETASFYEESDGWYSFQAHTAGSRRRDTALMWTQQEITFVTLKNRLVLFVWHKTPSVYVCLCIFFDLAFRFWCDLGWISLRSIDAIDFQVASILKGSFHFAKENAEFIGPYADIRASRLRQKWVLASAVQFAWPTLPCNRIDDLNMDIPLP